MIPSTIVVAVSQQTVAPSATSMVHSQMKQKMFGNFSRTYRFSRPDRRLGWREEIRSSRRNDADAPVPDLRFARRSACWRSLDGRPKPGL